MRVFFDYQAFEMQRIGGVSRSYAELVSHLCNEGADCIVGIKESDNVYLREKRIAQGVKPLYYRHEKLFEGRRLFKGQRVLTRKALGLWNITDDCLHFNKDYCVKLLKRQRFDVFEPTFFDSYFLPYLKEKPFVTTVHDMIPELMPSQYGADCQIVQKRRLCPLAAHIHVPSTRTKEDLVNILNILPERITVIPHGRPEYADDDCLKHPLFDFPYILYVGERNGYKNYSSFIEECSKIIQRFPEMHIVCTGKDFNNNERRRLADLDMGANVVHRFVDEAALRNLYHYAVAFVFPSAYEGFGFPIIEAFVNDCPVMLNNASCFPEVAGDAALYFDINEPGDLYERFAAFYLSGTDLRERMIQKGRAQAEQYSWGKSAKMLKRIYDSLL